MPQAPAPTERLAPTTDVNRWRSRRTSQFYRDLCRFVKTLHQAQLIATRILNAGHGDACKCDYCRHEIDTGDVEWLLDQIRGSGWPIDQIIAVIGGNA